jgi:hypothetical protein
MPALNAARTALICPTVNETVATSTCRLWSVRDDRFGTDSSDSTLGGDMPRRFASARDTIISRSSSRSVRCLTALGKSLGKMCRCSGANETRFAVGAEGSPDDDAEKRSGVSC